MSHDKNEIKLNELTLKRPSAEWFVTEFREIYCATNLLYVIRPG